MWGAQVVAGFNNDPQGQKQTQASFQGRAHALPPDSLTAGASASQPRETCLQNTDHSHFLVRPNILVLCSHFTLSGAAPRDGFLSELGEEPKAHRQVPCPQSGQLPAGDWRSRVFSPRARLTHSCWPILEAFLPVAAQPPTDGDQILCMTGVEGT